MRSVIHGTIIRSVIDGTKTGQIKASSAVMLGVFVSSVTWVWAITALRRPCWAREDDSPMSRRGLFQSSFVDAIVNGCGKSGGFLDRIDKTFDSPAFESFFSRSILRLGARRDIRH